MSIIFSQDIKGKLTHWVNKKYKDDALKGDFKLNDSNALDNKPKGLWLSWNNGWEKWSLGENFGGPANKKDNVCLNAKLKSNLKLWCINSFNDFMEVWNKFTDKDPTIFNIITIKENNFWEWLKNKEYDGVALTDKGQWATRFKTWLYGWDCASIVIFNPKNIELRR